MEVGSVASSVNLATNTAANSQLRQSQQAQQAQQSQQSQQTQESQQAQQPKPNRAVDESEAANRARAETEANRPTVNANGQTVGQRVNTTA